jgi:hypothetical protein
MPIVVAPESPDPARPFANLLPIVDVLVAHGNVPVDGGFVSNPAGWECRLREPIDVELVAAEFQLPPTIQASAFYDAIHDFTSWCTVEGPGADAARFERGGSRRARDITQP